MTNSCATLKLDAVLFSENIFFSEFPRILQTGAWQDEQNFSWVVTVMGRTIGFVVKHTRTSVFLVRN